MSTNAASPSFSLGAVVGITIAASLVVFIAVVGLVVLIITRKHKFVFARTEQKPITNNNEATNRCTISLPILHEKIVSTPQTTDIARPRLPSNESTRDAYEVEKGEAVDFKKRGSSALLSWPLPTKKAEMATDSKREYPQSTLHSTVETRTTNPGMQSSMHEAPASSKAFSASSSNQCAARRGMSDAVVAKEGASPARMKIPSTTPSVHEPLPLFTTRQSIIAVSRPTKQDRSFSVPSLLAVPPQDAIFGSTQSNGRATRYARSLSLSSHNFPNMTTEAYPPVPLSLFPGPYVHKRIQGGSLLRQASCSAESLDVFRGTTVNHKDMLDICTSHTSCFNTTDTYSTQVDIFPENVLIAGPQPVKPKHKIALGIDTSPLHLCVPANAFPETPQKRARTPNNAASTGTLDLNRLSVGEIRLAESVRLSRISNSSSQTEFISTIHVLSTPKRDNPSMRAVSVHKTPCELNRPSILRDISGNKTTPSRDSSQNSILTHMSEDHNNPFSWESPVTHKKSALKRSPGSKRMSKRATVRISSVPDFFGASNRSTSPSRMDGIAEERLDKPLRSSTIVANTDMPSTLDSSSGLQERSPDNRRKTMLCRASLTPSSPTLSIVPYHQDENVPEPVDIPSIPQSTMTMSLAVADRPSKLLEISHISQVEDDGNEPTPIAKSRYLSGDPPSIPGLTLISPPVHPQQELCYPTIEIPAIPAKEQSWSTTQSIPAQASHTRSTLLKAEKHSAKGIISGFSPPPTASATIQAMPIGNYAIPTIRPTPLSSTVDPSNTSPYLPLSEDCESMFPKHPQGPRPPPGQGVLRSIRGLRRDDSQIVLFKSESRTARHFLDIGRQSGPDLSKSNLLADEMHDDELERIRDAATWGDGVGFWESMKRGDEARSEEKSCQEVKFDKNNPLGITMPGVRGSLYDASGFLLT